MQQRMATKTPIILMIGLIFLLSASYTINPAIPSEKAILKTIVLDPGHGGKDNGCVGSKAKEKQIALAVALKLGTYIKKFYPKLKIVYTRKTDKFVPLHARAEIANRHKADLFISIHCNATSNKNSNAFGTETFVLGTHRTEENLKVMKRENEVILLEDNYKKHYDGFDPTAPETHILLSMFQNTHLDQSINLADKIETQFENGAKRKSRGVKQAGFAVLRKTAMPSVLIETGFLTNKTEERYLISQKGQSTIATSIFKAFQKYKKELEGNGVQPIAIAQKKEISPAAFARAVRAITPSGVEFKIQLAVTSKLQNIKKAPWTTVRDLEIIALKKGYRYLAKGFSSYKETATAKQKLRRVGFKDAFIVAYKNGKRMSIEAAKKQTQGK